MNRAERRRLQKQGINVPKEPVMSMKRSDIQQVKNNATSDAVDAAMVLLLALPVKVLHDQYGWGMKKRLPEFAEALTDEYQRFSDGEQSLQEYADMVFDYVGIKFQKSEGED